MQARVVTSSITTLKVYRLIAGPRPAREDFLSDRESGKKPRNVSPEMLRRHQGFSVWMTREGAIAAARRYAALRRQHPFVAEIDLPDGTRVEPFAETPDHLTAYGDAAAFVRSTVTVEPVDSVS